LKSATSTATINTLVIFVRFNGAAGFYQNHSYYEPFFNATNQKSLKNYIQEVSYSNLTVNSTFYPVCASDCNTSYEDTHTRDYYIKDDYEVNGYPDPERESREHGLVKRAVEAIASQVPTSINLDADNDGKVDHVCIVVQAGSANIDHADLLWPHRWALYTQNAYINNKQVYDYTLLNTAIQFSEETICHEFLHVVGMPDTYHNSEFRPDVKPTGYWDIMGDRYDNFPHPGAYLKSEYAGWISSIPEITQPGNYSLSPLTSSSNNCYKIKSQYSTDEYFIVEYRKRSGIYENTLEGDGLLVYRIYENGVTYTGSNDEVYIYRPNGTLTVNGTPQSANFSSGVGRTTINDSTNPTSFLKNGSTGGLRISNIGSSGTSITFNVGFDITISGSPLVCTSGTTYSVDNLPSGATVSWSCTGNNLTINPTTGYAYATNSNPGQGTISAVIHTTYGDITLPTKTVSVGVPIVSYITDPTNGSNPFNFYAMPSPNYSTTDYYTWIVTPLGYTNIYSWMDHAEITFSEPMCYRIEVQATNACGCSGLIYKYFNYYGDYLMSPNPASTEVEITVSAGEAEGLKSASLSSDDEYTVTVLDIYGSVKIQKKYSGNKFTIPVGSLKNGNYLVTVNNNKINSTKQLIIKH
jgi:M6 family metalloprotease-like protein